MWITPILARRLLIQCVILTAAASAAAGAAQQPNPTDAAEKVGEGNAARWLEFYRRERGEHWQQPKPAAEPGQPTMDPPQRAPPPAQPNDGPGSRR